MWLLCPHISSEKPQMLMALILHLFSTGDICCEWVDVLQAYSILQLYSIINYLSAVSLVFMMLIVH